MKEKSEQEKMDFINKVFEKEMDRYMNTGMVYEKGTEYWINAYITKSNFEGMAKAHLDEVYRVANTLHSM